MNAAPFPRVKALVGAHLGPRAQVRSAPGPAASDASERPPRPSPFPARRRRGFQGTLEGMTRRRTALGPVEVATAGILTGLAVALGLLASVVPVFTLFFKVGATIPVAMVASRARARAGIAAAIVSVLMAAAVGGVPTAWTLLQTSAVGLVVGLLRRRGARGLGATAAALSVGLLGAGLTLAILTLLSSARELALESTRTSITGYLELIGKWAPLAGPASTLSGWVDAFIDAWRVWLPASAGLGLALLLLAAHWLLGKVLDRLDFAPDWDPLAASAAAQSSEAEPAPLPMRLRGVAFTYPGSETAALDGIDLDLNGGFTVILGANGSGKSTLALVLAGAATSAGTVERPGGVGLGRPGGTAFVAQRSEIQFLGATVAEDLVWGLDEDERARVDIEGLLELVGLSGEASTQTRQLSGGRLQRLALAGALARRPALLVSDESTAMIDPEGRAELLEILASLPAKGTAVVHITHDPIEAERAERVLRLDAGRIVFDSAAPLATTRPLAAGESDEASGPAADAKPSLTEAERAEPAPAPTRPTAPAAPARPRPRYGALRSEAEEARFDLGAPDGPSGRSSRPALGTPGTAWMPTASAAGRGPLPAPARPIEHLWADRISHAYDIGTPWEHDVLSEVSFIVSPGSALLITGENGSGKSTLARILTGLMSPSGGRCTLGGEPTRTRVGDIALSRQFARLQLQRPSVGLDILSAAGYGPSVGTGRGRRGAALDPAGAERLITAALAEVGLDASLSRRSVDELSGGQMRRVALAGLLASEPAVLVLDEPMAGLDEESRAILLEVLAARKRAGLGLVVISHDIAGFDALCEERMRLAEGVLA